MNKVETVLAILDLKVGEEFRLRNNNTKDILVGSYFCR